MRVTAEIDGVAVLTTTEVCSRLGLQITSTLLKKMGIQPFAELSNGTYWEESLMPEIRKVLAIYILKGNEAHETC